MPPILSFLNRIFQQKYIKHVLVTGGIIGVSLCFGQDAPQYTDSDMTKDIIEIFDLIFSLLALVLGPMVILAGWLLSPDWTMGDFFGLRAYFKEVWILVANIVYIIFALMLLYMAIMQIFGGSESEYAFKKKLPSFLVGILIVPFTWLIVSWTLSFANQAVAAVLSIPMGSIAKLGGTAGTAGKQDFSMWHKKMLPTEFDFSTNTSGYGNVTCENGFVKDSPSVRCISPAEFLTQNQAGPFFIIMIYAYNIFKIQNADISSVGSFCTGKTVSGDTKYYDAKSCVKDLVGIVRDFGLSLIVTVFFAIMLIALCWMLLMRAIKLWIYIMLSPLFGLAYFTGKGMSESVGEAGESGFGQVGFQQFFKLAMVPVLVSAVLAFGLLFVGVVRDNFHGNIKNPNQTEFCTDDKVGYMVTYCITEKKEGEKTTYNSRLIIGTDTTTGDNRDSRITLNFGDSFNDIIGGAEAASIASGAIAGGISSVEDIFAHIILTMMALVFMFIGVKAAAEYDAVTKAAFAPFAKLGESVGNFVAHSPSYLPLPHPAFAALTPTGMKGLSTMMDNNIREREFNMGKKATDMFNGPLNELKSAVGNVTTNFEDVADRMKKVDREALSRDPKLVASTLKKGFEKVDTTEANKLREIIDKNSGSTQRLAQALESNESLVTQVTAQAGGNSGALSKVVEQIKQVGNVSEDAANERHIQVGGNSTIVNGNAASGLNIKINNQSVSIPTLNPLTPAHTGPQNPGFTALKNALDNKSKSEAKNILGNTATDDQIEALRRWLGIRYTD